MNDDSKIVLEWKRLADMDLLTARHLFETCRPTPIEIICFHSQQAAEKMLKCFLVHKGIEPPKTHDLRELLKMCVKFESGFDNFRKVADILTDYAVFPRYPAELELDESDGERALKYADKITAYINGIVFSAKSDESKKDVSE